MTKGLDSRRSRAGQTICCRRRTALRAVRAAASRSGGPQACPAGCARHSGRINIRSKNHCSAPSAAFLLAIAPCARCGLPQPCVGSLDGRRRKRELLVLVGFFRRSSGELPHLRCRLRKSVGQQFAVSRSYCALRPSICREAAFRSPALQPAPPRHQKPAYRATGRRKTGHPRMHGRPRHAPCTKKPRGGILRANKRARVEPPTDAGAATDPARP